MTIYFSLTHLSSYSRSSRRYVFFLSIYYIKLLTNLSLTPYYSATSAQEYFSMVIRLTISILFQTLRSFFLLFLFFQLRLVSLQIFSSVRDLVEKESFKFIPCKALTEFESVSIEDEANSFSKLAIDAVFFLIFVRMLVILYPYCFSFLSGSIIFSSLSLYSFTFTYFGSNRGVHLFLYRSVSTGQVFSIDSISVLISKTPILFYIRD